MIFRIWIIELCSKFNLGKVNDRKVAIQRTVVKSGRTAVCYVVTLFKVVLTRVPTTNIFQSKHCPEFSAMEMGICLICNLGGGIMQFVEDFRYGLHNSQKNIFCPIWNLLCENRNLRSKFSKKILYNPLMGCSPFVNLCFQMGVTIMGFAEHFGQ